MWSNKNKTETKILNDVLIILGTFSMWCDFYLSIILIFELNCGLRITIYKL